MRQFLIFIIYFFIFSGSPVFLAQDIVNCTSSDYYYNENSSQFSFCYSDCECDGLRYCNEDNDCQGVARNITSENITRFDPNPTPTPTSTPNPQPDNTTSNDNSNFTNGPSAHHESNPENSTDNNSSNITPGPASPSEPNSENSSTLDNNLNVTPANNPETNPTPIPEPIPNFCEESEMSIVSHRKFKYAFIRGDSKNINLQFGSHSYEKWLVHFNEDSNSWCFQNNKWKGKYLSFDGTGCGKFFKASGCGRTYMSNSCGDKEKFLLKVYNGYSALSPINYNNRYLRINGVKTSSFSSPGSGLVNSQYWANGGPSADNWEAIEFLITKRGKCLPKSIPIYGFCEGSIIGFKNNHWKNFFIRGDGDSSVNLQFGQKSFEHWIVHNSSVEASTGETLWLFENNKWKGKFLNFDGSNCPDRSEESGCGKVTLSNKWQPTGIFKLVKTDGGFALQPLNSPNRYIRFEGNNNRKAVASGIGVVNSQYYTTGTQVGGWEVFSVVLNQGCGVVVPGVCDGSLVGIHSISNSNAFLRGDSRNVNLQFGQRSYEHWIVHSAGEDDSNGRPLWCFENNKFKGKYISINTHWCSLIPQNEGCGNLQMSSSCRNNEMFAIVKSSDGYYGLQSKAYGNRFARLDAGSCIEFNERGCGVVNTQNYYDKKNQHAGFEKIAFKVNLKGDSCNL